LYRSKFFSYPLKPVEALWNLGIVEAVRCAFSYAMWRVFPKSDPRSFEDWVSNQFGKRLYEIFFRTYTEKVWGMKCSEISADWAAQRIKGLSLGKAVANAFLRRLPLGRRGSVKTLIEEFDYPRLGPGMMWSTAASKITQLGGEVRLGARVTGIQQLSQERWRVTYETPEGAFETVETKHVLSTLPIRELSTILAPKAGFALRAQKLRYRDFLTVVLIARDEGSTFDDNWIYVHEPGVKVGRIQNFKQWSPDMVPDSRFVALGLEYFCFENDGLWNMSDTELVALARKEIVQLNLMKDEHFVRGEVVRQKKAYPVYDDEYREIVAAVRDEVRDRFPGLHLVGRNGMHKYNNQDHSMMTAMLAVRNIAAGAQTFDPWLVNEDAEYHEEQRPASTSGLRLVPRPLPAAPEPVKKQPILSELSRRRKVRLLAARLPSRCRILEVGAGDGYFAGEMRRLGHDVVTLDQSAPADVRGDVLQWRRLGLQAHSFDVVIAMEVIEHVDCLDALVSLAKPGGLIYLSSPHPRWDWALALLEKLRLLQRRTSAHTNLVDFATLPLERVFYRRPLGMHQVGLFRTPEEGVAARPRNVAAR
jgi:protoporphyrinogen oxidase/2-polyprenyl-3-methyl-5-hydroxy-6-metoxy-1,4-benzoquinol methylase